MDGLAKVCGRGRFPDGLAQDFPCFFLYRSAAPMGSRCFRPSSWLQVVMLAMVSSVRAAKIMQ